MSSFSEAYNSAVTVPTSRNHCLNFGNILSGMICFTRISQVGVTHK